MEGKKGEGRGEISGRGEGRGRENRKEVWGRLSLTFLTRFCVIYINLYSC